MWLARRNTTPGGDVAEEYNYTPYGRMIAKVRTASEFLAISSEKLDPCAPPNHQTLSET